MARKPSSKKKQKKEKAPEFPGVNREDLLACLATLRPGLTRNDMIEQGTCFTFAEGLIAADNDFISIAVPFDHGLGELMAVQGEELYKLISKLPCDRLVLESNDGGKELLLLGENEGDEVRAGLASLAEPVEPKLPSIKKWNGLPSGFVEACQLALFSVSTDMTRPHLTCLWVQGSTVTSSDNYRITEAQMGGRVAKAFLLPGKAAESLVRHGPTHYALTSNWLYFKDKESGMVFGVRRIEADIPDVTDFFVVEGETIHLPDALIEAVDRSRIMVEGDHVIDLKITLSFGGGMLVCRGQKELGWIEETMECEYEGEPFKLVMNPVFLAQILEKTPLATIGKNVCLFEEEGFKHVVSLS